MIGNIVRWVFMVENFSAHFLEPLFGSNFGWFFFVGINWHHTSHHQIPSRFRGKRPAWIPQSCLCTNSREVRKDHWWTMQSSSSKISIGFRHRNHHHPCHQRLSLSRNIRWFPSRLHGDTWSSPAFTEAIRAASWMELNEVWEVQESLNVFLGKKFFPSIPSIYFALLLCKYPQLMSSFTSSGTVVSTGSVDTTTQSSWPSWTF